MLRVGWCPRVTLFQTCLCALQTSLSFRDLRHLRLALLIQLIFHSLISLNKNKNTLTVFCFGNSLSWVSMWGAPLLQ